jgi:hypothetical protein
MIHQSHETNHHAGVLRILPTITYQYDGMFSINDW